MEKAMPLYKLLASVDSLARINQKRGDEVRSAEMCLHFTDLCHKHFPKIGEDEFGMTTARFSDEGRVLTIITSRQGLNFVLQVRADFECGFDLFLINGKEPCDFNQYEEWVFDEFQHRLSVAVSFEGIL